MGQKRDMWAVPLGHSRFDVPLPAGKIVFFSRTWERGHGPRIEGSVAHAGHIASGARSSASLACLLGVPVRPRYETRPPLRNRCALPAVRAAGSRFRSGIGTVSTGRCTLGRLFGRAGTARPSPWRSALARCMGDRVHVMNSWQSSRKHPVFMLLAKCIT